MFLTTLPTEALMFLRFGSNKDDHIQKALNHLQDKIFQCLDPFPFYTGQANEPILEIKALYQVKRLTT